jgi:hypothetical protein
MNELLPIIRRVRRPLLTVDVPPPVLGSVEPVQVNAELGNIQQPTSNIENPVNEPAEAGTTNEGDAQDASIPTE